MKDDLLLGFGIPGVILLLFILLCILCPTFRQTILKYINFCNGAEFFHSSRPYYPREEQRRRHQEAEPPVATGQEEEELKVLTIDDMNVKIKNMKNIQTV
ncbi:hypothetical protein RRG08_032860 [Elysia crispata]|uniref:Uncharacterized protein n=1 Tax=Elysia crispata TaxID=231223 RepID=A0AAE1DIE4_9GAST|nr:hypothetical protein RRG08_032860 [Elysia crispata]